MEGLKSKLDFSTIRTQFLIYMLISNALILIIAIIAVQWVQMSSTMAVLPAEESLMTALETMPATAVVASVETIPAEGFKQQASQGIGQFKQDFSDLVGGRYLMLIVGLILLQLLGSILWIDRHLVKPINMALKKIDSLVEMDYSIDAVADSNHEMTHLNHQLYVLSETLKKNEAFKSEELDRRKSLIAGISHDLRTPLTNICGYTETLIGEAHVDEQHKEWLQIILRNAYEANGLITDLLDLNRLDMTSYPVHLEEVDVIGAIKDALSDVTVSLESNDQKFNLMDIPSTMKLQTDRTLFIRLIKNIITNFIEHAGKGTCMTMKLESVEGVQGCTIVFKDNGNGVEANEIPRLTDIFYISDPSRTHKKRSGLGLYNCKQIMDILGGMLEIRSGKGDGFEVRIHFNDSGV